jgi:CBS domain-containing protein
MIMIQQTELKGSDIINHKLTHISCDATVLEASKLMRKLGSAELLVTEETSGLLVSVGVVTASDIVTRVIAAELDPAIMTTGDIACQGITGTDSTERLAEQNLEEISDEALAVLDGDGRLVGTLRLHEFMGMRLSHLVSAS